MQPPPSIVSSSNTGRLFLAIQATNSDASLSQRRAAAIYNVPYTSLAHRVHGRRPRRDCEANGRKLTTAEEDVLVKHILEQDSRGFPPTKSAVRAMADTMLEEKGGKPIGKNWTDNFIKRKPELKVRMTRFYNCQRALNKDLKVISKWFKLVRNIKAKHSIINKNTYNFNKTGFIMGVIIL